MSLGLARDSMLDLAEMARQVDDGEFKTSIEISAPVGSDNLVQISSSSHSKEGMEHASQQPTSTQKQAQSNPGFCSSTTKGAPVTTTTNDDLDFGETKTPDPSDNDEEDEKSSVASNSIDSDSALRSSTGSSASVAPSSVNGDDGESSSDKKKSKSKEDSKENTTGRYSGFHAVDYDDYYQDYTAYSENQAPKLLANKKTSKQPWWFCFAPWMNNSEDSDEEEDDEDEDEDETENEETFVDVNTTPPSTTITRSSSKEEDETSVGSDALGERLSDKNRQAVLARLRLAQPDEVNGGDNSNNSSSPSNDNTTTTNDDVHPSSPDPVNAKKGLLNGISIPPEVPTDDDDTTVHEEESSVAEPKKVRGILRQQSRMSRNNLLRASTSKQGASGDAARRRSLFPNYSETTPKKKNYNVTFSPMARVLSVKSQKDMEEDEKGGVWWQKSDYEEFRKTGRMITKAMLEGGSEIWLATNRSWQMPNQNRSTTLRQATTLSERQTNKQKDGLTKAEYENTRDKWWHSFGHSRRGLEHIASIDEGRQRQGNVRRAIRAVVEENKRQKAFFREDADKLRMVSLQNTTWARDLALAAGASDADAVHTNFDDESRKSREFYLLKFSRAQTSTTTGTTTKAVPKTMPAFMRPATSLQVQPNRLDANTMSQIRYRQTTDNKKKLVSVAPSSTSSSSSSSSSSNNKDTSAIQRTTSMAKKAAGYASGEEVGNMSAVLTGMGGLPKSATTVGGA
ncbi:unnamed protein product [Cylindrotheca closterium]|uniref:Uncharacterized protein n=1 Tax=Cylindrotheca closterium TaxID=2856 RepID=A0AAD2FYU7_9STRA|nr:unnamed protein product [Cylindrotheca closterium]